MPKTYANTTTTNDEALKAFILVVIFNLDLFEIKLIARDDCTTAMKTKAKQWCRVSRAEVEGFIAEKPDVGEDCKLILPKIFNRQQRANEIGSRKIER